MMTTNTETRIDISAEVMPVLHKRVRECEGAIFFAYMNVDLSSRDLGDVRFLLCGPNCTYKEPPKTFPDSHLGIGWRYTIQGRVDLPTGRVVPLDAPLPGSEKTAEVGPRPEDEEPRQPAKKSRRRKLVKR